VRETRDTFTLELEPADGGDVFTFAPGQFNMLYVFGVGEVPVSISGNPDKPRVVRHTIRSVGTVTQALRKLRRGDVVGVRGPFGARWPVAESRGSDILIMAGGIGLAPLRPAIYALAARRGAFGKIAVLYGARTPDDLLYVKELDAWRERHGIQTEIAVDSARRGWQGHVGVVTGLVSKVRFDPRHAVAMICGPEIMMRYSIMELQKHGMRDDEIFVSMERNMKCAVGFCGHCQFGPAFVCKDGPVFRLDKIKPFLGIREV
jgi:NAD(P)H-flavin reductase